MTVLEQKLNLLVDRGELTPEQAKAIAECVLETRDGLADEMPRCLWPLVDDAPESPTRS